ncbi:DUF6600 domain-containing protein [Prosthecobacter sp.]|uniref:DUF6600 domain-containing protein n=1 Tax=Prosthecobacter sp. TaxID=1965333 RepID=UPI00378370F6
MKRSLLLLCAALLAATAPLAPAQTNDAVPVDFFYDALSPYGDWIYTPNYGYVWQPLEAQQQQGWLPYTDGSWAYTDAGWTWVSNEDFGWLTYHYGRWIRLLQGWVWVPGYEWAPAWVSWRQTQGQIGWAPLPPEAAWVPGVGFGGWTDSYYDVGPAYYNFVPIGMFASRGSLRPFILDHNRNFTYYGQSANITHTTYQPNVMNHIFVGGPDPQRIDGLGSNQVRRLTLRRDDEGFRREWLERDRRGGGPHHGGGGFSRIEQDHLVVAAPAISRAPSHALPAKVREPFHQAEADRGWRGAGDAQSLERLRQQQREEMARTRPPNLPEKNLRPATSTTPPPAFGRVLQPEERSGAGGTLRGEPRHVTEEVRPAMPLSAPTPPGIPPKKAEEPGLPHRERGAEGRQPGPRPGENQAPPAVVPPPQTSGQPQVPHGPPPGTPANRVSPHVPTPPASDMPNAPTPPRGVPGHPGHPGRGPEAVPQPPPAAPVAPPHANPAPLPPVQPQQPAPIHPLPPQGGNPPHTVPVAPQSAPPGHPHGQGKRH